MLKKSIIPNKRIALLAIDHYFNDTDRDAVDRERMLSQVVSALIVVNDLDIEEFIPMFEKVLLANSHSRARSMVTCLNDECPTIIGMFVAVSWRWVVMLLLAGVIGLVVTAAFKAVLE